MAQTVNIQAVATEAFVFPWPWTGVLDLAGVVARMQMRSSAADPLVRYEWSTTNGRLTVTPVQATGWIAFTQNPAVGDTLRIGDQVVTFVAGIAAGLQVPIGASLPATLGALLALLAGSTDPTLSAFGYALSGAVLGVAAKAAGVDANATVLATSVAGTTASGATLTGGCVVFTSASPEADMARFAGSSFVYDLRLERNGVAGEVLYGGSVDFVRGVTRGQAQA